MQKHTHTHYMETHPVHGNTPRHGRTRRHKGYRYTQCKGTHTIQMHKTDPQEKHPDTQIHTRHTQPEMHIQTLGHAFIPKETPCTETHIEMSKKQPKTEVHPDRDTLRSTPNDTHKDIPRVTKAKTQTCLERDTTPGYRHTEMCSQTHPGVTSSPVPSTGHSLPRTHNLPCSLGRCPHAGRAGPSRGPPPAHSDCLCGPLGTRSSGSCPCPRTAHQPDTAAPEAPLDRGEQRQAGSLLPAHITHSTTQHPQLASVTKVSPTLCQVVTHPLKLTCTHLRSSRQLGHTQRCRHPGCLMVIHIRTILVLASCHRVTYPHHVYVLCRTLIRLTLAGSMCIHTLPSPPNPVTRTPSPIWAAASLQGRLWMSQRRPLHPEGQRQ